MKYKPMRSTFVEEWIKLMVLFAYKNVTERNQITVLIDSGGYHSWRAISEPGRRIREE